MGRWFWILVLSLVCVCGMSQTVVRRSSSTITLEGKRYYMHTVSAKETLYAICKAYGVSEKSVEERNPFIVNGIRTGQLLFIPTDTQQQPQQPTGEVQSVPREVLPREVITPPVADALESNDYHNEAVYPSDSIAPTALGLTAPIDNGAPLEVALMLPFGGGNDITFVDFYRGAIIAIDKLKEQGLNINLNVLSTNSSPQTVLDIIKRGELNKANLIIGPVYDKPFEVAASYASTNQIPIISPLAPTSVPASPFIIEAAPTDKTKWDKVVAMLSVADANVVVVDYQNNVDSAVMVEIEPIIGSARRLSYIGKPTPINSITSVLDRDKNNIIFLPSSNENAVEGFLARLSSINSTARYKITVVGTSRWGRFNKLDFELFFKLGVVYPSSYHADRSDVRVADFYNTYINRFSDLPSLFSFRGYDVAKGFISLIAEHSERSLLELGGYSAELLQMPYRFEQSDAFDKFRNSAWGLVRYNPDFTIAVE